MVDMVDAGQSGGKQVETFHDKSDERTLFIIKFNSHGNTMVF